MPGSSRRGGVMRVLVCSLAVLAAVAGRAPADPPPPAELLAALVGQLGSDDFARRDAAVRRLQAAGEPALPALKQAAATSPDREVRDRAERVIGAILGQLRASPSTKLALQAVRPGQFQMGSPAAQPNRKPDEGEHRVRVTAPFLIGVHEVTQDEYRQVTADAPSHFAATGGGKDKVLGLKTDRYPVESVTWFDAVVFCNLLSKLDGYPAYYAVTDLTREKGTVTAAKVTVSGGTGYRLPTEAEWEYACRAETATPFHFGTRNTGAEANLRPSPGAGGYGGGPTWQTLDRTAVVGTYKPNKWGLYDLHGNAGEWCGDWYAADYYLKSPADDPPGPAAGTHRVVRGGSWLVPEGSSRSASRYWMAPGDRNYNVGFRVARTP